MYQYQVHALLPNSRLGAADVELSGDYCVGVRLMQMHSYTIV